MSRRSVLAAALAVVALGWSQPMPPADAAFTTAATAGSAVATHTLSTPVLDCSGGGLLSTTVTLTWPKVPSAATPDPYASPPNSKYLADGYEIHRAVGNGGFSLLTTKTAADTAHADNVAGDGSSFRYMIRAKKEGWTGEFSNVVTASALRVLLSLSVSCSD
jgi:hypothetical protein